MLHERSQLQRTTYCMIPIVWNIQNSQSVETKQIGDWLPRGRKTGTWWLQGTRFFGGWWKLMVVMRTQLCDYIKKQWIVHFTWVDCMAYAFYLNKAVFWRFTDLCSRKTGKASEEVALELLLLLAQSSQIVNRWHFTEHLWARHCVKHFTITTSLIPHKNFTALVTDNPI